MASLGPEQRYGLSSEKPHKKSLGRTLFHVKLTDTALRALEAYQQLKGSLSSEPSICFKGNQGYIKIPASTPGSPSALRVFSFYLSSDSKDQPQASFDCIHQYVSSDQREQLEVQGSIQDKITVCATEDSYQMTRERLSQVEKDSWSRSAIEIKPGATRPSKCIKYQKRPAVLPAIDLKKQSGNSRRSSSFSAITQKPLKERIIHLLALKAYRKPELLLWLEREKAGPKDKAELGSVLEEVAKLNLKDNSYLLRDDFYKEVHCDWPGYSEEEKQLASKLLARKLHTRSSSQSLNSSVPKTTEEQSTAKQIIKRPVPFESLDGLASKRQKLTDQRLQQPPPVNGLLVVSPPNLNSSVHTKTEFQRTTNPAHSHSGFQLGHGGFSMVHKGFGNLDSTVSDTREVKISNLKPTQTSSDCTQEKVANSQHKKKKSKRHKDKDRERLKDDREWMKSSPDLKHDPDKLNDHVITDSVLSEEKPDYVLTYTPIKSLEQRKHYLEDFCSEYDEYKDLHSRIATITRMFVQLESKIKNLSPGTKEYKIMEDQILEKYNKYRKKFPGYREEKKRCEYLHEKLAYIKQRVVDYDVSSLTS